IEMIKYTIYYLIIVLNVIFYSCQSNEVLLHVFSDPENDLLQVVKRQTGIRVINYSSPLEAVKSSSGGDAILILSDNYPEIQVKINDEIYDIIKKKKLRAYIEFPS